jgi:uncharacterized membrane protein
MVNEFDGVADCPMYLFSLDLSLWCCIMLFLQLALVRDFFLEMFVCWLALLMHMGKIKKIRNFCQLYKKSK